MAFCYVSMPHKQTGAESESLSHNVDDICPNWYTLEKEQSSYKSYGGNKMKKFLAILLAAAMVLSVSTFAFAEDIDVFKLTVTDGEQSRIQFQYAEGTFAEGDKVEILVNLPDIVDADTGATAVVKRLTARVYGAGSKWTDEKPFDETWVEDLGNNWYKITFEVTLESEGITMGFFYFSDDGTENGKEAVPSDGSVIYFATMAINGVAMDLDADYFEGSNLVLDVETTKMASPYATEEPTVDAPADETEGDVTDKTDDETDDKADTTDGMSADTVWIITGAVVAVALVAAIIVVVVLKKKKA